MPDTPDGWEFRLSPDRRLFAIYEPGNAPWFIPEAAMRGRFVESPDMNRLSWTRYLPASEAAAEVLRIVSAWCVEANDTGGIDAGDLAWRLEQAGYPLPDVEDGDDA